MPYFGFEVALGLIDGLALAATTATLAVLARMCRTGPTRRAVVALGVVAGLGAGVRAMTLVECAAACAVGLALVLLRRTVPVLWSILWLALPAALTAGWYYVLNRVRYGDATATSYLVDIHDRPPGIPLTNLSDHLGIWKAMAHAVVMRRGNTPAQPEPKWWFVVMWITIVSALVVTVVLLARGAVRRGGGSEPRPVEGAAEPPPVLAWAVMLGFVGLTLAVVSEHVSNGGSAQNRYLMPALPIVAALVALGTTAVSKWLGAAVVVAVAVLQAAQLGPLQDSFVIRREYALPTEPIGPAWVSTAGLVLAAAAGVALVAAIVARERR
jgi:hypothetical protein